MTGRVIQGFFVGGGRLAPPTAAPVAPLRPAAPVAPRIAAGPPAPAFARQANSVQRHAASGRPPLVHAAPVVMAGAARPLQRFGGDGSFAVDPAQVGLVRSGGAPLPGALLAKMEAVFGADFSGVRVHVGPQASRIGALAFTTGNDLYFAPGQYQPDSIKGQQLIGHELAHVIQQRQGRVRAPGSGVAVVQDRALEAEADRLGMKAAAHRIAAADAPAGGVAPAMPAAGAIQLVKATQSYERSKPAGARGKTSRFTLGTVRYLEDSSRNRWRWDPRGHWVSVKVAKVPLYGRFRFGQKGRGSPRAASFLSRLGSAASYSDTRRRRGPIRAAPIVLVTRAPRGRRTYVANMRAATMAELAMLGAGPTGSATVYASHFAAAPVIVGGYNWCHLAGHGGGGSDDPANLVSASTHANSEQLAIERITYTYRDRGVAVRAVPELVPGSAYLARRISVDVFCHGTLIYSRVMDGFRATRPSGAELRRIERDLTDAIHDILRGR